MKHYDPRIYTICKEYGVDVVISTNHPRNRETRAAGTLDAILRKYGEDHFRMVILTLAESANNHAFIDEYSLWATSDLVRVYKPIIEAHAGEWLETWDKIPVGRLQALVKLLWAVKPRHALAAMIHDRLAIRFHGTGQLDLLNDRRL